MRLADGSDPPRGTLTRFASRTDLSRRAGEVNALVVNLLVAIGTILIGLPLVAAAGGWLLAGREPPAIAHQPLE